MAGCATSLGAKAKENETLKTQVASVESQMSTTNQKLEQIAQRQEALESEWQSLKSTRQAQAPAPKKTAASLSAREIQLALKSAGFYTGPIDGKLGSQTREAVKTFQRSNHLTPDGVIGTRTSVALAKYLEKSSE